MDYNQFIKDAVDALNRATGWGVKLEVNNGTQSTPGKHYRLHYTDPIHSTEIERFLDNTQCPSVGKIKGIDRFLCVSYNDVAGSNSRTTNEFSDALAAFKKDLAKRFIPPLDFVKETSSFGFRPQIFKDILRQINLYNNNPSQENAEKINNLVRQALLDPKISEARKKGIMKLAAEGKLGPVVAINNTAIYGKAATAKTKEEKEACERKEGTAPKLS